MLKKRKLYWTLSFILLLGLVGCGKDYKIEGATNTESTDLEYEYSVTCTINEDDRITKYNNIVCDENSIAFYENYIESISNKELSTDYMSYFEVDKARLVIKEKNTNNVLVSYALIYLEYTYTDDVGDLSLRSIPGLLISEGNSNEFYELSGTEYTSLQNQIENDAISSGNQSQTTLKTHSDSYYEITDVYPKDQIYFINRHQNWAEGYQCSGYFIDEHGYLYEFDLSNHNFEEERQRFGFDSYDDAFLDALYYEVYYKNTPVKQIDESYYKEIWDLIFCINYDSECVRESVGCDMGQYTLYTCIDFEMLEISSIGDWECYLDDESAIKLTNMMNNIETYCIDID